jgi:kynurenine formamidase
VRGDASVYADDFPSISVETAKLIRTELLNVKAVAIDTLSIESCKLGPQLNFPVHKSLLDSDLYSTRSILIFEDVDMKPVIGKKIHQIYAFPLRLVGLDGSPVTIVAEVQ